MSEETKKIIAEFDQKPEPDISPDILNAIKSSRLDLSLNIPDPQMLV